MSGTVSALWLVLGGCTSPNTDWDCHRVNVPGGQTVECVGQAPQAVTAGEVLSYPCVETIEDWGQGPCPSPSGPTTDGTGDYTNKTTIGSSTAYGTGGGGGVTGGQGTTPTQALVPECTYGPDLDYCTDGSSGGTGSTTGSGGETYGTPLPDGGTSGGSGVGNGHGGGNKSSTDGGSGNGGETYGAPVPDGGTNNGGGGGGFNCTQEGTDVTCTKTPVCAPGLHPTPCGACVPNSEPATADCVPPAEGGCWFTGGGFILSDNGNGKDTYGGNGKPMKDGRIQGEWNHVDHNDSHAHGKVEYLVCRVAAGPGPKQPGGKKGLTVNQVYFGGHARYRVNGAWGDGYWYDVVAEDHGEPGNVKQNGMTNKGTMPDYYHFTLRNTSDPVAGVSGSVVYESSGPFEGGNFQIHPNNAGHPYTMSSLPAWVQLEH